MRLTIVIAIVFSLLSGCSKKQRAIHFSYIKVLTASSTDRITTYNKGFALHNFLYYEPETDSIVFRFIDGVNPLRYKTYIGKFNNTKYLDTIENLVEKLQHHTNGFLPDNFPENRTYDGARFLVEFRDEKGLHNNAFIVWQNDTLGQFDHFFHGLLKLPWERKSVDNNIIKADSEIVEAAKKTGIYEN